MHLDDGMIAVDPKPHADKGLFEDQHTRKGANGLVDCSRASCGEATALAGAFQQALLQGALILDHPAFVGSAALPPL